MADIEQEIKNNYENVDNIEKVDTDNVAENETEDIIENKIENLNDAETEDEITFKSLGICAELCEACEQLKWKKPTLIQKEALPVALKGTPILSLSSYINAKKLSSYLRQ